MRLALLFLERQHSHVELRANSIWLGKGQYLTLFFVSIYISRYNLEADKQPLVFQPAARRSRSLQLVAVPPCEGHHPAA